MLMKITQGSGEWAFYFQPAAKLPPGITWVFEDVSDSVGLGANYDVSTNYHLLAYVGQGLGNVSETSGSSWYASFLVTF